MFRYRRLGAVIMFLAAGSCAGTVSQSSRRKTVETKPYTDACQAANDKECVALCAAAFELGNDKTIESCSYDIQGEVTVIHMTWKQSDEPDGSSDNRGCAGGRKPCGWEPSVVQGGTAGSYLAWCAQMEAASVTAFMRIHRHLVSQDAPESLLARVRDAFADEVEHARVVANLARRYGAVPVLPEIADEPTLSDLDRAIDNVVAGCVGETVSALHAAFLGEHASDPLVREAFVTIAEDETRHAELAFALAAYYDARLSDDQRALVAAAREAEAARVIAEPLPRGLLALGLSEERLDAATRELLADPSTRIAA